MHGTLIDFHNSGRGMAVGKVSEQANLFDVNLETKFRQGIKVGDIDYTISQSEFETLTQLIGE